jgi:hypothetical protein
MEGGLGLDSDKLTFATLIRSALLALGERDKLMLLHRVQVRGWLADAGVTDRAMLVAFSEMAADGALYRWWHDEGAPVEETTRIVASLGMESAVSRALLVFVLSPAKPPVRAAASGAATAVVEKHDGAFERLRRWLAPSEPLPDSVSHKQVRDLYEHFVAVQLWLRQTPIAWEAFETRVFDEVLRLKASRGSRHVTFRVVVKHGKPRLQAIHAGLVFWLSSV